MIRHRVFLCLAGILVLSACASGSYHSITQAKQAGFSMHTLQGNSFQHVVFFNSDHAVTPELHVYLDGDGKPWLRSNRVASDPTPKTSLMMQLMSMDDQPSLLLGRPCYYGLNRSLSCQPALWTQARFSESVVDSMESVLQKIVIEKQVKRLHLYGYSGGGTLAMLLAERELPITKVITLAGNLDIDAWADHHNYSRLQGSLNPAHRPALRKTIKQIHLLGEDDQNITLEMIQPTIDRQSHAEFQLLQNSDHHCCWKKWWPAIKGANR